MVPEDVGCEFIRVYLYFGFITAADLRNFFSYGWYL